MLEEVLARVLQTSGAVYAMLATPTLVKTGAFRVVPNSSGGVALHSGATRSVLVKSTALSGYIVVGSASNRPFYTSLSSGAGGGVGLILDKGEEVALDVDNFGRIYVCAEINNEIVTFIGVE